MVGKNTPFPYESGINHKKHHNNINTVPSIIQSIKKTLQDKQCSKSTVDVIVNLFQYMEENQWNGACHATSSVLFVVLSELGLDPVLCYGEVACDNTFIFDHSWVEINGSVLDLACYMTLQDGLPVSNPVLFGNDIVAHTLPSLQYGVNGCGLDAEALYVASMSFCDYMDGFPFEKQGLWGVIAKIMPYSDVDIDALRKKYANVERIYRR